MAEAFSTTDKDTYVSIEEFNEGGNVTMHFESPDETHTITVEAGDLARALLTASPTFTAELGRFVEDTIRSYLGGSEEEEPTEASVTSGD